MSILARQQASPHRDDLVSALFPQHAAGRSIGKFGSGKLGVRELGVGDLGERLARQQLWLEVPTFVGVLAAVLGALFL